MRRLLSESRTELQCSYTLGHTYQRTLFHIGTMNDVIQYHSDRWYCLLFWQIDFLIFRGDQNFQKSERSYNAGTQPIWTRVEPVDGICPVQVRACNSTGQHGLIGRWDQINYHTGSFVKYHNIITLSSCNLHCHLGSLTTTNMALTVFCWQNKLWSQILSLFLTSVKLSTYKDAKCNQIYSNNYFQYLQSTKTNIAYSSTRKVTHQPRDSAQLPLLQQDWVPVDRGQSQAQRTRNPVARRPGGRRRRPIWTVAPARPAGANGRAPPA